MYIFKGCDGAYALDTDNDLWRKQIQQPGRRIISAEFFILTAMFAIVSFSFLLMVKKYHQEFYAQFSTLLWSAALVLTIPLLIRCLMDSLTNWNLYEDYTNQHVTRYNFIFFLLTTYILILSQIATLVFGFMRAKESKKLVERKKEIK